MDGGADEFENWIRTAVSRVGALLLATTTPAAHVFEFLPPTPTPTSASALAFASDSTTFTLVSASAFALACVCCVFVEWRGVEGEKDGRDTLHDWPCSWRSNKHRGTQTQQAQTPQKRTSSGCHYSPQRPPQPRPCHPFSWRRRQQCCLHLHWHQRQQRHRHPQSRKHPHQRQQRQQRKLQHQHQRQQRQSRKHQPRHQHQQMRKHQHRRRFQPQPRQKGSCQPG